MTRKWGTSTQGRQGARAQGWGKSIECAYNLEKPATSATSLIINQINRYMWRYKAATHPLHSGRGVPLQQIVGRVPDPASTGIAESAADGVTRRTISEKQKVQKVRTDTCHADAVPAMRRATSGWRRIAPLGQHQRDQDHPKKTTENVSGILRAGTRPMNYQVIQHSANDRADRASNPVAPFPEPAIHFSKERCL